MWCDDWPNISYNHENKEDQTHFCVIKSVWIKFDGLVAYYNSAGHKRVRLCCSQCHYTTREDLSHKKLKEIFGYTVDQIPIVYDNRKEHCERCGTLGAENHHWAPSYKFSDSHRWPTSWLCQSCHREWHLTMDPKVFDNVPR